MDRLPDWRPVEPQPSGGTQEAAPPTQADLAARWRLAALCAIGAALVAGGGLVVLLVAPSPALPTNGGVGIVAQTPPTEPSPGVEVEPGGPLMVDISGAVELPGLFALPAGSRVGDAITAAGGYSAAVDLELAAVRLNLAARLSDGDKIHVPRRGEQAAEPSPVPSTGSTGTDGGPINVNTADQRLLETLPGIGPVTAGKIIAARTEAPFAAVDDLLARKVVGQATFEKIRPLVSVGP